MFDNVIIKVKPHRRSAGPLYLHRRALETKENISSFRSYFRLQFVLGGVLDTRNMIVTTMILLGVDTG